MAHIRSNSESADAADAAAAAFEGQHQQQGYSRMIDDDVAGVRTMRKAEAGGSAAAVTTHVLGQRGDEVDEDDILVNDLVAPTESHTRSIVKGLTWRFAATATTTVIAFLITGQVDVALQIGLFEFLAKLILYYLHERIWTRIPL